MCALQRKGSIKRWTDIGESFSVYQATACCLSFVNQGSC